MGVFISHAVVDKPLLDAFVDLLQTGVNIPQGQIFCTSLEGHGIPAGQSFVSFIRDKLKDAKFVISTLTVRYYESPFCLCELGATWLAKDNYFPLLVPPLDYDDLKAVLYGMQSGAINDKRTLNQLRDRLIEVGVGSGTTGRWEEKRDTFLRNFPNIQKELKGASVVKAEKYEELQKTYESAQTTIDEKNVEISKLKELIEGLKKAKDKTEVAAVLSEHRGEEEQFNRLTAAFEKETQGLSAPVMEALYYEHIAEPWSPRRAYNEQEWEGIDTAAQRGFLKVTDGRVYPDETHPKIKRAQRALIALANFVNSKASPEFAEAFEEEHDFPLNLSNRDFWQEHLGL